MDNYENLKSGKNLKMGNVKNLKHNRILVRTVSRVHNFDAIRKSYGFWNGLSSIKFQGTQGY
jgi:hypothetical protein